MMNSVSKELAINAHKQDLLEFESKITLFEKPLL